MTGDVDRETLRAHLVAAHHWPAAHRYEATFDDLDEVHDLMHDPARHDEALICLRGVLGLPDEDDN